MEANILNGGNSDVSREIRERSPKMLLWIALVSIGMMFAGLTSGYIVRRGSGTWIRFEIPFPFYISTAVIIISSITMNMALRAAKNGKSAGLSNSLLITWLLGIVFGVFQFMGFKAMVNQGIFLVGTNSNASGSYLYILALLHIGHLVGGLVAVGIAYVKSLLKKYSADNFLGIRLCSTYWHFLDGLWVYLFIFMLLNR